MKTAQDSLAGSTVTIDQLRSSLEEMKREVHGVKTQLSAKTTQLEQEREAKNEALESAKQEASKTAEGRRAQEEEVKKLREAKVMLFSLIVQTGCDVISMWQEFEIFAKDAELHKSQQASETKDAKIAELHTTINAMTAKEEQMAEQINAGKEINETLEVITFEYNRFEIR